MRLAERLDCEGESVESATIWGGKRQIHRADDERKRVGARLGERGVRGRRGGLACDKGRGLTRRVGLAGMGVTWSILLNSIKASPFLTG